MTWIRKRDQYSNEECTIALQAKQKKRGWYVDSGCSKHMTGDRDKFLTLREERDGSVSFGNDDSTKIIGNGTIRHYYIWVDYSTEFFYASTSFIFFLKRAGFSSLFPRKFVAISTKILF